MLHHRGPAEDREHRPRIFQDARLVDHVDLDMRARMNRQAIGLDQKQNEEGGDQEEMRRAPVDRRLGHEKMIHHEGQHRLGEKRDADEDEDQRRFRQYGDHDRPAGPDAAIGAAGVETRQRDHEGSEGQDQPAAEDVAHVGQRQGIVGENRDQDRNGQRRGEGDDRGRPIEPGGRFRRHDLFVEELPEVTIGLKNSRTLAALDPLLELQDHALEQRREQQRGQNLGDLQNDVANDHRRPPRKGSSASRTSSQISE